MNNVHCLCRKGLLKLVKVQVSCQKSSTLLEESEICQNSETLYLQTKCVQVLSKKESCHTTKCELHEIAEAICQPNVKWINLE
jgi:malonyl CoA-acyl carrier protein transacylase